MHVRTLLRLAINEQRNYPIASTVLQNDFYVDVVMAGCDDLLRTRFKILITLLRRGCNGLRKCTSHSSTFVENIPPGKQVRQISASLNKQTILHLF